MATVTADSKLDRDNLDHHPVWSRAFSQRQRRTLTDEDLTAGRQIPAILIGVLLFGFLSMVLTVWLAF